jgi:hypothetical protein
VTIVIEFWSLISREMDGKFRYALKTCSESETRGTFNISMLGGQPDIGVTMDQDSRDSSRADPLDLTAMIPDNDGTTQPPSWIHEIALSVYPSYLHIVLLSSNNERAGKRVVLNQGSKAGSSS